MTATSNDLRQSYPVSSRSPWAVVAATVFHRCAFAAAEEWNFDQVPCNGGVLYLRRTVLSQNHSGKSTPIADSGWSSPGQAAHSTQHAPPEKFLGPPGVSRYGQPFPRLAKPGEGVHWPRLAPFSTVTVAKHEA